VTVAHDALRRRAEQDPAFARRLDEASGRVQGLRELAKRGREPQRAGASIDAAREALLASAGRIAPPQA
jgi:hypothetical protein